MPKKNSIPFADLSKYTDSNSFVWTALTFNPKEKADIEAWLKEIKFMPKTASILDMKFIDGNVKGKAGRSDVLFITSETRFAPLVRLQVDGLKWTSDFRDNYGADYGMPVLVPDVEDESDAD